MPYRFLFKLDGIRMEVRAVAVFLGFDVKGNVYFTQTGGYKIVFI